MKTVSICTLALAGTLTAVNTNAAISVDKIQNNVLRRIVSEAQQPVAVSDKPIVLGWAQAPWQQSHPWAQAPWPQGR